MMIGSVDLTEQERTYLLIALWRHINLRDRGSEMPENVERFLALTVIGDFQSGLVRKLGGDPTAPLFGLDKRKGEER